MHITDLITVERILCGAAAVSSKQAMDLLSELLATGQPALGAGAIAASLIEREELCSTGLCRGVAIPHGRLKNCTRATGAFLKLEQGVDFNATDRKPVDMLFAFIVPEQHIDEHLEILALLAHLFSDRELCAQLRRSTQASDVFELMSHWQAQNAPA
ncbi:MAG: sugar transporter subunit [Proteobacteria bacterium]|nr:sugar transporter subunit [Pseudomonadota bacterium]